MRKFTIASLTALCLLQAGTALAADCKLQLYAAAQMTRTSGGVDTIPVLLNGARADFLFDTGGARTQIGRALAQRLNLDIRQGNGQLFDLTGHVSRDVVTVKDLVIAHMHGADQELPVSPITGLDGIVGLDHFTGLDVDMDFGSDQLKFFSPDHCDGQVVYWTNPASVGIIPMDRTTDFHIHVTVTLDGHTETAILDSGATASSLGINEAERAFAITPGDADTPEHGVLNGDATLKTYAHHFSTLSFGDVSVKNPQVMLIPDAVARNDRQQLVGDRTKSEKDLLDARDMIIGMDVLRKLHIYVAFKEHRTYISPATLHEPVAQAGAPATTPPPATGAAAQ